MTGLPVALIESDDRAVPAPFRGLAGVAAVRAEDIDADAPARFSGVIVGMHADQRRLAGRRALHGFLRAGRRVLFNGHHVYPVLPDCEAFRPLPAPGRDGLALHVHGDHPLFDGLDRAGLARRKGVAGFYGRGAVPAPAGARPVTAIGPDAWPVDWEWDSPMGGRVFMHAGNDIWTVAEDEADRARIAANCIAWTAGETAR